jgi:hypothetical protein
MKNSLLLKERKRFRSSIRSRLPVLVRSGTLIERTAYLLG